MTGSEKIQNPDGPPPRFQSRFQVDRSGKEAGRSEELREERKVNRTDLHDERKNAPRSKFENGGKIVASSPIALSTASVICSSSPSLSLSSLSLTLGPFKKLLHLSPIML